MLPMTRNERSSSSSRFRLLKKFLIAENERLIGKCQLNRTAYRTDKGMRLLVVFLGNIHVEVARLSIDHDTGVALAEDVMDYTLDGGKRAPSR